MQNGVNGVNGVNGHHAASSAGVKVSFFVRELEEWIGVPGAASEVLFERQWKTDEGGKDRRRNRHR
jgi:hypothetical protein